uniref:Reverse transcriptase domain-containing protein n=1 Tax=Neogobius melanostomus TaxID=47308 RepID=A0A8C6WXR2_9GOBI
TSERPLFKKKNSPTEASTRQGCPASPALFILALEPLACAIRANENIQGIDIGGYNFKASLYADDILLTLTNPNQSISQLLTLLELFGKNSGYKINCSKSEAIPLNQYTFPSHLGTAPFVWKSQGMKYLGIVIKSPICKIFELNGPNILKTIKEDIRRWAALPLSLWGRAEVIKMNLLPRLTFPISAIPLKVPQKWFKEIDTLFTQFLWNGKKPRINRKKLTMPKGKCGLGVPSIYMYYLAFNVRYPLTWGYNEKNHRTPGSWEVHVSKKNHT